MQWPYSVNLIVAMNYWFQLATKYSLQYDSVVNWSHSGFTDRLFHTTASAPFRKAWHAANHIICGVLNRLSWCSWKSPWGKTRSLGGKQAFAPMKAPLEMNFYERFYDFHKWDFSFLYIIHGCLMDYSWQNTCYNFFTIQPNALGLLELF